MPLSLSTPLLRTVGVTRLTTNAAAWIDSAAVCLPVNFYYGYWFSHWRA